MTVEGQDWAGYQAAAPNTTGLDFVVVKATEGSSYTNPDHGTQVATARAHGLVVGHYHFARPGSMSAQADYFLAHAGAKAGDFLAFDWEDTGVSGADKDAWLRYVKAKAPGHRVVLYCNRDFWLHHDTTSFCADGLWVADPSAPKGAPRVEHPWLFHQYSDAGGLDRNVGAFTDLAALAAWAHLQEDDMTPDQAAQLARVDKALANLSVAPWQYRNATKDAQWLKATGQHFPDAYSLQTQTWSNVQTLMARLEAQTAAITVLAQQLGSGADVDRIVTAVTDAIASAVVHVEVTTGDDPAPAGS